MRTNRTLRLITALSPLARVVVVPPLARVVVVLASSVLVALGLAAYAVAHAQAPAPAAKPPAAGAAAAPPAAPTNCKAYSGGKCCDPAVMAHLPKDAVFSACGESDATYLGEKGTKDNCQYMFKADGKEEAFVEVYAPQQKEIPSEPNDPFFAWKKVGKVFVTDKAKSPKSAPMIAAATGLWMPGKGYTVSVRASTKVCTKAEALRLAKSVR